MLDIKYIRAFPDKVREAVKLRKAKNANVDEVLELDKAKIEMIGHVETHRALRNQISDKIAQIKDQQERKKLLEEATKLKQELKQFEDDLKILEGKLHEKMLWLPNIPCSEMPRGDGEEDHVEIVAWVSEEGYFPKEKLGKGNYSAQFMPKPKFKMKSHVELGEKFDMIDIKQSALVSGSRFTYLKNDAVILQDALASLLKKKLHEEKFVPMVVPLMVRERVLLGTSHFPEGYDQVYKIENTNVEENAQLYLVGSSEPPLFAYHMDKVLDKKDLPYKMYALTSCFRSEVGSWGKDVYGIKRVHQFDKLEIDIVTTAGQSREAMEYLREINEWFYQTLKLPYRIINKCTGDCGYLASHKQYDTEVWLPSQGEFIEVGSNTNTTDYQARRLNIRYKDGDQLRYAHTVNDTGCPMGRVLIAIIDNYQTESGTIKVPDALISYVGKKEIS